MNCSETNCQRQYYAKSYCKLHYEHERRSRGVPTMSQIHNSWMSMKQRCYYIRSHNYPNYGGRGIGIHGKWRNNFMSFYDWSIVAVHIYSVYCQTIDVAVLNGPANCRWITNEAQQLNRRNNRRITIDGVTMTTTEWSKAIGINHSTVRTRLQNGWDERRAILTPARKRLCERRVDLSRTDLVR